MATQYPGTLDSFATSAGTSLLTSPDHSDRHNTEGSAIIAVETLLGTASGSNYLGTVKAVSTQLGTYVVNATPTANNILVADANAQLPFAARNRYICVLKNTTQPTLTSYALLTFDTEITDPANMHSTSSNAERIVVPNTGIYRITAFIRFPDTTAGTYRALTLYYNTSTIIMDNWVQTDAGGRASSVLAITMALNANDYVWLAPAHDIGSGALLQQSFFSVEQIG
jgi:hypothetical protein